MIGLVPVIESLRIDSARKSAAGTRPRVPSRSLITFSGDPVHGRNTRYVLFVAGSSKRGTKGVYVFGSCVVLSALVVARKVKVATRLLVEGAPGERVM